MTSPPEPDRIEDGYERDTAPSREVSLKRIQILNLCFIGIGTAAGWSLSQPLGLGILVGGLIMAVNFRIIVGVMRSVFLKGTANVANVGLYWAKFAGVMLLVGVLIAMFQMDAVGLLVGLSLIVPAVFIEAVVRLIRG